MHSLFLAATPAAFVIALATAAFAQLPGGGQPPNLDTDRDGKVTFAEYKAGNAERQARMFARMDANRDGKITQAEMQAAQARAQAEGRGPPPGAPAGGPPGGRGPGGFLLRMDANKDGGVTKAEMAAGQKQRFDMADTNHDGWLSKGEVLMMRQRGRGGAGGQ